jgi:translation elongation factor EF-Tu-like GTPase
LVRRYQSGDLQESLEKRFSIKHIQDVEGELERGIEKVGNATQQVLKALSKNKTSIKGIEDALNDTGLLTQVVKAGHSSEQKNLRH